MNFSTGSEFPESAPAAYSVFYRTYSRRDTGQRETWQQVCDRSIGGLARLGQFTPDELSLVMDMQRRFKMLTAGRWLWVGGTEWSEKPENFPGSYNCSSTVITDWQAFGLMMDLAMMGCGTGAMLEPQFVNQLPPIQNQLNVTITGQIGSTPPGNRREFTDVVVDGDTVSIFVGDSRQGWVKSYQSIFELASDERFNGDVSVVVDVSDVRPQGEKLQGFGGVANPVKLPALYGRCTEILNKAVGRQLTPVECCLLIDEAAVVVVAGNVRRSAGMRQGASDDAVFAVAKDNLWQQDADGTWRIDPERDALRMANHTRVFHHKPSQQECLDAVRKQFYSGEGAIQYAPEAIARANADLLDTPEKKQKFIRVYCQDYPHRDVQSREYLMSVGCLQGDKTEDEWFFELEHRLQRYGLNPCGEILLQNNFCNLSEIHLNQIDPFDFDTQRKAFTAGGLAVAALLNHRFTEPRYQKSRDLDPIVGVSFTGLFDFFVHAFGVDWLKWWGAGRPDDWNDCSQNGMERACDIAVLFPEWEGYAVKTKAAQVYLDLERRFLTMWRNTAHEAVWQYCDRHGLKRPNRCTTVQPAGSKSLLTGASSGWHPPKAQRFIRRITFRKNDPVALACLDYGYSIVPSQSDKDENGNLLNDPFDSRCTEWLVEIPVEVSWANLPGADTVDISQFSALAQFDFYMQVQRHYTTHNTSATIELREHEIEPLANRIYQAIQNDEGYISAALLARFDDRETFPRLPFEPISKETYQAELDAVKFRRKTGDFHFALSQYDSGLQYEIGPAGCDSDKCMLPETK